MMSQRVPNLLVPLAGSRQDSRWAVIVVALTILAAGFTACAEQRTPGPNNAAPSAHAEATRATPPQAQPAPKPMPPMPPARTAPTATPSGPNQPALAPTAAPNTAAARTFTVIGAGDILLHSALWSQAARDARDAGQSGRDFNPLFASIKPAVSAADLAICHLETPVGPEQGPFSDFPLFSVPPQVAPALAQAGYDSCSTASNHSIDRGEPGIVRTLDALDAAGIRHAGTARSPREQATLTLVPVKGVLVAHLSYTFSFNGLVRPRGKEWLANYLKADAVLTEARRAKQAGAEVVIVSIHWGTEYSHTPNRHQTSLARRLLGSADIDLILGHHSHVVQPLERIGDKWVAYGMGNQVAWQNFSADTRDGIMPRFTFTEVRPGVFRVTQAEVVATHMWLDSRPARLYDINAVLSSSAEPAGVGSSCAASLRRTKTIVGKRGAFDAGLLLVGG